MSKYHAVFTAPTSLGMNTCAISCSKDCIEYTTPVNKCYNPSLLFPKDEQWGTLDALDTYVNDHTVKRTFFKSTDGTCNILSHYFFIPLHEKVGPIGPPRPCGEFYYK